MAQISIFRCGLVIDKIYVLLLFPFFIYMGEGDEREVLSEAVALLFHDLQQLQYWIKSHKKQGRNQGVYLEDPFLELEWLRSPFSSQHYCILWGMWFL